MIGSSNKMPGQMPVDMACWMSQLHLSNFVNAYYQLRDVEHLPDCRRILVVGPGQGLGVQVLRWRGFDVTTLDVDPSVHPDVLGSVHDMSTFGVEQFDVIIVSHVLEHLPVTLLDAALSEMARIGRFSLLYVPKHGVHLQLRLSTNFYDRSFALIANFFNYLARATGDRPDYMSGQHFWEMGLRGFRAGDLRSRLRRHFQILHEYRNPDWPVSYNFVLRSANSAA